MLTTTYKRPSLRGAFLRGERRLDVYFYTSNLPKYLHASTVFSRSGLPLKHFKTDTDPYDEDYSLSKTELLTKAITQVVSRVGASSLFFVEDTSLRIDGLSEKEDFPGLRVKEWFASTRFSDLNRQLKRAGNNRRTTIKSDIALYVPELARPLLFHGETNGVVAGAAPRFQENDQFPWLSPHSFNGWIRPDGARKRLGEMSLEESWQYDFRTQAIERLITALEEFACVLNLPSRAYVRRRERRRSTNRPLFDMSAQVLVVVGKTCAGKSTFGQRAKSTHNWEWVEASDVLRDFRTSYEDAPQADSEFARHILETKGADAIARRILALYEEHVDDGLVITGFRTIEELETIKNKIPDAKVVLVEATDRNRFERYLARGRTGSTHHIDEFKARDEEQWRLGLLRVAEDFADLKITNVDTLADYQNVIDQVISGERTKSRRGLSVDVRPKHGLEENQLYRCLAVLADELVPLDCGQIQQITASQGSEILHNNANKVLKKVPELARRLEIKGEKLRYQITTAGQAYIRYMRARFEVHPRP